MDTEDRKLVKVAVLDDPVEVSFLRSVLEELGLNFLIEPIGIGPFGTALNMSTGSFRLMVFPGDEDQVREILDKLKEDLSNEEENPMNQGSDS
ncbi:MAG: hypothetical protein QF492_05095 [Candidatus Krumholzibacteria bacterium]|nr:hypothetical protein [Candidatus Krumholzibacteria bacterium]MDP6669269.1 hypothetical protein [Candidatus Krumholzibacteria bacterium]MDP6796351.1 hypothetical protein [Candidatus Krumholzibacteria bacterium]MDP7021149.1 hypothetical protein [Candidatus Krumholzibacteria bacterium]